MTTEKPNPVDEAIAAAGGSQELLAHALGVSQQFISKCQRRGWMPADRAAEVEMLFGIPRHGLVKPKLRDLLGPAFERVAE